MTQSATLDIGYFGNLGRHLIGVTDVNMPRPDAFLSACLGGPNGNSCNQPFAFYNYQLLDQIRPFRGYEAINLFEPSFTSNYNSLRAHFEKRFSSNSLITVNYTWSQALGSASNDFRAPQNTYNVKGDYGNLDFDRRHVFTATYIYSLPFLNNRTGVAGRLFGGWQLSGVVSLNAGRHYTASSLDDPAGLGTYGPTYSASRPDLIGDPQSGAPRSVDKWFNTAAFAPVPKGQIRAGDERQGTIVGPGYQRWDASVFKNVTIRERRAAQLRGAAFNILNTRISVSVRRAAHSRACASAALFSAGLRMPTKPRKCKLLLS